MVGPTEVWQQAADCFGANLAAVSDEQWSAATGCGDWTVRELADHAIGWQAMVGGMLGAETSPEQGWDAIKDKIGASLADPATLEGDIEGGPMNGMPKHQAIGFASSDILLHAWDIARAIGADDTLPAEAVEAVHMGMQRAPAEVMRGPNMFGPIIEVPEGASAQDKLIGFAGRQP